MKRFVPIIVLVLLLVIAGGVTFGFIHRKQARNVEMTEFYLCETRFNEGQHQNAAQLLETFLREHPGSEKAGDAYYYLAMAWQKLGDSSRSMTAWSKIIERYPKSPKLAEAYYYLGAGYQEQGQYDKAMENFKIVADKFPNAPVVAGAWCGMGKYYEMKGQESEAINAYRKVMDGYPDTEFADDAERGWGNINLKRFLEENTVPYEVKKGDSLPKIAAKFHITPELIMRVNNLKANALQLGQVLKIVKANFNIIVDLSSHKISLRSGDTVVKRYPICIGKKETPTPTGDFKVIDKLIDPVWYSTTPEGVKVVIPAGDPRNELGTRWIGFKPAYGIHGTIDPASIGESISHGCIRMLNEDAEELYDIVVTGTPVRIVAEENKAQAKIDKPGGHYESR